MPEPLAMPVARTVCFSPTLPSREADLGTVSVVMMARAASAQPTGRSLGRAAIILSAGRGSRMTPVEKGRTWVRAQPACSAAASQTAMARSWPSSPVPALALPVLMTRARTPSASNRCCLQMRTGAAQKRFWVNTAPTVLPLESCIRVRSSCCGFLMPACPTKRRMPSMAWSWPAGVSR